MPRPVLTQLVLFLGFEGTQVTAEHVGAVLVRVVAYHVTAVLGFVVAMRTRVDFGETRRGGGGEGGADDHVVVVDFFCPDVGLGFNDSSAGNWFYGWRVWSNGSRWRHWFNR